jgi:dolichyl-phosphate beta-glucosyltransferase
VLPVHNEEAVLDENIAALERHLAECAAIDHFEILLVCNGCTDRSVEICSTLAASLPGPIRTLELEVRGLGHAIREGIKHSTYDTVLFYAVDLPFGLSVVDDSVRASGVNPGGVVIGSKGHPASVVARSRSRQWFSFAISVLNNLAFDLDVSDTQGSMLFPKDIFVRHPEAMDSPGAFFQAQIVIYGRRMGCPIVEIPVTLETTEPRKTRLKLVRDGLLYLREIVRERRKLRRTAR